MIKTFQDLICWQKSRKLVQSIYGLTKEKEFSKDFGLKDQIQRASVSVMSNIAEGFSRKGDKEFRHFLFIAISSNSELQSLLFVALDQSYISQEDFSRVSDLSLEVSKMISKLAKYLKE